MKNYGIGVGRRKSAIAVAQVFFFGETTKISKFLPNGKESFQIDVFINKKEISNYFQNDPNAVQSVLQFLKICPQPLRTLIKVSGGGITSQKEAIFLALGKAICSTDSEFCSLLKNQNPYLLTQDARVKERKKYGLKKARKAPQYSKR